MKNIKIILFAFLSFSLITSCDGDFEELNTDPDRPSEIPGHLLLGFTQRIYMNTVYSAGRGGDMGECWGQHWSKVQYNDEARYVPRRGVIDGIWNTIYASVISEANAMYLLAEAEGNTNLQGVALVMQAVGYQTLTDLYGPIPFTEAVDPSIVQPAYDDEATVYNGIITMLTQASSLMSNGTGAIVSSSDLFYGGDVSKWHKLANSLKFRALMRISSTKNVNAELQALINGGNMFSSNADNAELVYLAAQPDANPIYETIVDGNRAEYKVNSVLVEMLTSLSDYRLPLMAGKNASGVVLGKPSGYGNETTLPNEDLGYTYANISPLGDFYLNPELPGVLMAYSQLSFLKAEAANEMMVSGGVEAASNYYKEGITASFEWHGLNAATYLSQDGIDFSNQADGRSKISTQEWIALFGQGFETWTEWRRTGYPDLTPAIEGDINEIPSRLYYPTTESSLNKDNFDAASASIGGDKLTSPLFWQ